MSIVAELRLINPERRVELLEQALSAPRPADDSTMARAVAALEDGASIRDAAKRLGLHRSTVARLRERAITEGSRVSHRPRQQPRRYKHGSHWLTSGRDQTASSD